MSAVDFDAVVVGASLAGCTAASLLADAGLRVALVEARADADAFKRPCTHFLQASATPTLARLGVVDEIERAGGVRNSIALWSRRGWVHPPASARAGDGSYGYTIRREKLDPIVRERAARTDGVELMLGHTAIEVRDDPGEDVALAVRAGERRRVLRAPLLVAADGRNSAIAKLTGTDGRPLPNGRSMYYAYYADLPLAFGSTGQLWYCEPEMAYTFPADDGLTLVACSVRKERVPAFKRDADAAFADLFARLPLAPRPSAGKRATPFMGKLDMTNRYRGPVRGRLAFVGDAAITPDPSWAVGCGWALRSAEWLADSVAAHFADGVETALRRYGRRHRLELVPAFIATSSYSVTRPMLPQERLLFRGAARDRRLAEALHGFGGGTLPVWKLFTPATIARATWASTRRPAPAVPHA